MTGLATHERRWAAGALLALALAGCGGDDKTARKPATTPPASTAAAPSSAAACRPGQLTPEQTEGPYYKEGSPERERLAPAGTPGRQLVLSGVVRASDCRSVPRAVLEFWQADASGEYDNSGFRLRGHVSTDASGRYRLQTIIPGQYPGRTPHIHVKVQPLGGPELTTQLYFPDSPGNSDDPIFDRKLLLPLKRTGATWTAQFDFVVKT